MSKLFWAMLAFISRLPVPSRWSQGLDFEQYSRGIVMFPFIGLILGGVSGLIFILLQSWCGIPLAALFCILALALLTGGFHLDGLADTCDGIFPRAAVSECWRLCAIVVWEPMAGWRLFLCYWQKFWWSANWRYVERQCWRRWQRPVRLGAAAPFY